MQQVSTTDLLRSRLISKATTVEADGTVTIVAVFELSSYYKFFHVFKARTARTPRRCWKYTNQYYSIYAGKKEFDFYILKSFLANAYPFSQKSWRIRNLIGVRFLADLTTQVASAYDKPAGGWTRYTPYRTFNINSLGTVRGRS